MCMKKILVIFLGVIFVTLLLPLAVVYLLGFGMSGQDSGKGADTVRVYISDEQKTEIMDIDEYIKGVVAAEMPADFEEEALKAQAVAARTYLYSRITQFDNGNISEEHPDAPVCTDYKHCQAYISKEKRFTGWGDKAEENWDKITRAVSETTGRIMTYGGEIISALFHSTSSGVTEDAADVWGSDVPYLKSVRSEGDMESPKYLSSLRISVDEYKAAAEEKLGSVDWSKPLYDNIERSGAGGIISIEIGGVKVRGVDFRTMFDLRSTNAEITEKDGCIIMSVRGYGHGVGMSQYGANYMAEQGSGYEEILKTYYTGIEIERR